MEASLKHLIDNFSGTPLEASRARREILDLLKQDRQKFSHSVVQLLKSSSDSGGYQYLCRFMVDQGLLYNLLCDPSSFTLDESVAIGHALQKMDSQADVKLARLLVGDGADTGLDACGEERILEICTAVSSGTRLLPILVQLLKSPNRRVRSKAALLVGRMTGSARPIETVLGEPDPRVC
ncbi:MAG: hypothetical protein ABI165_16290, partial [Bryobacteraceae bacterium]